MSLSRLHWWLRGFAMVVVVGCALQLLAFSFGRDQGIYATVGSGILSGKVPYLHLWDFKPPGIFLVYALAEAVFGHNMAAPRVLEAAGLVAMALAMGEISEHWYGSKSPGWIGAAIAAIVHVEMDFWHSGQPESFAGILTILALWLAVRESSPRLRPWLWAVAGTLLGFCSLLKPPLGGVGIILGAYLARQQRTIGRDGLLRGLAAMVFGAMVPFLLCAGWFWLRGGWSALLWTFKDYVPGYTALGWQGEHRALEMFYFATVEALTRFSALIVIGVTLALMLPVLTVHEQSGTFLLLGCAVVQITGIALQGKFFQYHYGATTPLLSLVAGLGWHKLWGKSWARRPTGPLLVAATVIAALYMRKPVQDVPGTVPERSLARFEYLLRVGEHRSRALLDADLHRAADYDLAADRKVAEWVEQNTEPRDAILVWGFEPVIYWLTGRRPATRFIYNVPQRSPWQTEVSQRIYFDEVRASRPTAIVVQHHDVFPGVTGYTTDSAADLARFPELERYVADGFEFETSIEDFDLYRRKL
ncbi:MAG: ArnT family glycosyltransferase [Myxococcales bacterium]